MARRCTERLTFFLARCIRRSTPLQASDAKSIKGGCRCARPPMAQPDSRPLHAKAVAVAVNPYQCWQQPTVRTQPPPRQPPATRCCCPIGFCLLAGLSISVLVLGEPMPAAQSPGTGAPAWLTEFGWPSVPGIGLRALGGSAIGYFSVKLVWRLRTVIKPRGHR